MSPTKMRPILDTLAFDEALRQIIASAPRIARTERVQLEQAAGRVLAVDATSRDDVPPFNRAAMDGYAVVAADTFGACKLEPRALSCVETVYTGRVPTRSLSPGECAEIATGAPMPDGADAVVMVEETDADDDGGVQVFTPVYPGQNVGRRGADIKAGQTILDAGMELNPSRIGALAATGTSDVEVFERPRIAILSTGDEIVEPGQPLEPGHIYDINRFTLATLIPLHGGVPVPHKTAPDDVDDLGPAVDACLGEDVVVFSGGSSVGERDLVMDVIEAKGEVIFHGIAVKPGKPTVFGRIEDTPILGMPGYPTSCLSNAYLLLIPLLRHMARLPDHVPMTRSLPISLRIVSTTGRHQFFTIRIVDGIATPAFKASGDITSMSQADGYIEIPAQTDIVEKDEIVEVRLF